MPATPKIGMDHDYYKWSPISSVRVLFGQIRAV